MHLSLISALLCFCGLAIVYRRVKRRSRHVLPPGPRGLPFIGNMLQMPVEREWSTFADWAKTFGDIMHLSVLGSTIIVLSSPNAISDLLEKKSALYSDRPRMPLAESIGYVRHISSERYGNRHREGRKIILSNLSARKTPVLQQMLEHEIMQFLPRLLSSPALFRSHIRWYVANTVLQITHGHHVEDFDDPVVRLVETVLDDFSLSVRPGTYLIDNLPFMKYLPNWVRGIGFKGVARERRNHLNALRAATYGRVKREVAEGTALPSITTDLLENNSNPTAEQEDLYESAPVAFYLGGADTTVSALESFFLIMVLYPDIQCKAQAELDRVLKPGCLPKISDRSKLPYIDALIKEVHRWNPVVPMAVAHRLIQEDVYRGYHLPEGSIIIPNGWAVMHDPSLYPDPFNVIPERYLNVKEVENLNPDPRLFVYGYGRRICPGQVLAEDTLFIVITMVLATLKIDKAVDSDGLPIEPKVNYTGATIHHAGPFECRISPRSAETEQIIMTASGYDKI